eukprot:15031705-Alexandrium_andersonii.AAC.1
MTRIASTGAISSKNSHSEIGEGWRPLVGGRSPISAPGAFAPCLSSSIKCRTGSRASSFPAAALGAFAPAAAE